MSERRHVAVTASDIVDVERALYTAYRGRDDSLAARLGALALRMRAETGFETAEFHCNIDESAGMAEVVDLQGYSRRA